MRNPAAWLRDTLAAALGWGPAPPFEPERADLPAYAAYLDGRLAALRAVLPADPGAVRREVIRLDGEAVAVVEDVLARRLPPGARLRYRIGTHGDGRPVVRSVGRNGVRVRHAPASWGAGGAVCLSNPAVLANIAAALRAAGWLPAQQQALAAIVATLAASRDLAAEAARVAPRDGAIPSTSDRAQ